MQTWPSTAGCNGKATSSTALVPAPCAEPSALIWQSEPLSEARDAVELQRLFKQRLAEASGKVALVMRNMHDVQSRLGEQESRLSNLTDNFEAARLEHAEPQHYVACPEFQADELQHAWCPDTETGRIAEGRETHLQPSSVFCFPEASGSGTGELEPAASSSEVHLTAAVQASSSTGSLLRPEVQEMCGALVEELQHVYELAARGEQASRDVERARLEVEGLCAASTRSLLSVTGSLDPQVAQLLQLLRVEFNTSLRDLRAQVLQLERRFNEQSGEQAAERAQDPSQLGGSAPQRPSTYNGALLASGAVTHEELDNIVLQIRQDTAELMSEAVHRIREDAMRALGEEPRGTQLVDVAQTENEAIMVAEQLTCGLRQELSSAMDELRRHCSQLADRCDQVSSDVTETKRGLDTLHEELAPFQTTKPVTQQDLEKSSEFLSQEFKLMLDMTMHQYHAVARQDIAQARSELRRELRPLADFGASDSAPATKRDLSDAVDQLRQELFPLCQEKDGDQAATRKELMEAAESIMEEVRAEIATSCEKLASQLGDTHRSLATLIEDVGILKARGKLMGEEADSDKEALEQRLRSLQQEHKEALASLRAELPPLLMANSQEHQEALAALRAELPSLLMSQKTDDTKEDVASDALLEKSVQLSEAGAVSEADEVRKTALAALLRAADSGSLRPMVAALTESQELACEVSATRRDLSNLQCELLNFTKLLNHDMAELARQASRCENAVTKQEFSDVTASVQKELLQLKEFSDVTRSVQQEVIQLKQFSDVTRSVQQELAELTDKVAQSAVCDGKASTSADLNGDCEELRILRTSKWVSEPQLSTAMEQLREELRAERGADVVTRKELSTRLEHLHDELLSVAPIALQQPASDAVNRQELVELVDFLKEEIPRRAAEAAATEVSNTRRNEGHAMETSAAELAATQRSLENVSHDVGALKAWQGASCEEAAKEREALEQRFRLLRQEYALAIEELRAELPRAGPETERPALQHETIRESQNGASSKRPGAAGMSPSGLHELHGAASPLSPLSPSSLSAELPSRDFGTLREDLTILKSRQEFLKNELKSLVDSASRGAQQPVGAYLGIGRSPAFGAVADSTIPRKEIVKSVQFSETASS